MDAKKAFLVTLPSILSNFVEDEFENIVFNSFIDDEDREVEIIMDRFNAIPRISIVDFFEETVPKYSEVEFIRFFRISRIVFDRLTIKYANSKLYEIVTNKQAIISPKKSLAIFLWFAAHQSVSYRDISNLFNISLSTVHSVIYRSISFLSCLAPEFIKWPSLAEMEEEAQYHQQKGGISKIVGEIFKFHRLSFQLTI